MNPPIEPLDTAHNSLTSNQSPWPWTWHFGALMAVKEPEHSWMHQAATLLAKGKDEP